MASKKGTGLTTKTQKRILNALTHCATYSTNSRRPRMYAAALGLVISGYCKVVEKSAKGGRVFITIRFATTHAERTHPKN